MRCVSPSNVTQQLPTKTEKLAILCLQTTSRHYREQVQKNVWKNFSMNIAKNTYNEVGKMYQKFLGLGLFEKQELTWFSRFHSRIL